LNLYRHLNYLLITLTAKTEEKEDDGAKVVVEAVDSEVQTDNMIKTLVLTIRRKDTRKKNIGKGSLIKKREKRQVAKVVIKREKETTTIRHTS
jgi:hypothetical protein